MHLTALPLTELQGGQKPVRLPTGYEFGNEKFSNREFPPLSKWIKNCLQYKQIFSSSAGILV